MVSHRAPLPSRMPLAVRLLAGLLVFALLVAAQNLHAPMAHADDALPAVVTDGGHGGAHDHAHAHEPVSVTEDQSDAGSGPCTGSICALCVALVPALDLEPARAAAIATAAPILASPDTFAERLYRPPILPV